MIVLQPEACTNPTPKPTYHIQLSAFLRFKKKHHLLLFIVLLMGIGYQNMSPKEQ